MKETEKMVISFNLTDEKFIATLVPSKCGKLIKLRTCGDCLCVMEIIG